MRAKEFTINIPINIKFNGNGDPEVDMPSTPADNDSQLHQNPVMIPPLQQQIELHKAELGKDSPVISKITGANTDDTVGEEPPQDDSDIESQLLDRIKNLIKK